MMMPNITNRGHSNIHSSEVWYLIILQLSFVKTPLRKISFLLISREKIQTTINGLFPVPILSNMTLRKILLHCVLVISQVYRMAQCTNQESNKVERYSKTNFAGLKGMPQGFQI